MSETPKKQQFNIRLNGVAEDQLERLSKSLNLSKAAVIKMAIAEMHKHEFPDPPATTPPPPPNVR